jgi:DNA (cytosine-5)-methyltransferase 1
MKRKHVVAGLFAGVGGLERGLARAGHETALLCENDPGAMAVLEARFEETDFHEDVCTLRRLPRATTLLAAGFPCQDLSQAGKTVGIAGARSGLVAEVFRLIEQHRTAWVLLENVPFMLQLGRGEAMNVITTTLEALNYRWAYRVVDTRSFGLPQRRRRVYLVAALEEDPRGVLFADEAGAASQTTAKVGDPCAFGFYWTEGTRGLGWAVDAIPTLKGGSSIGIPSPPAILLDTGEIVTPSIRDAERLQGFPTDWTKPAEAVTRKGQRWKLVGNAVSVPVAEWIGRRLREPGTVLDFDTAALKPQTPWPMAAWNVGQGRVRVAASEWPVRRKQQSLSTFLRYPTAPLSAKATAGFLSRAEVAPLNFDDGFLDAIRAHLQRMALSADERGDFLPRL